MFAQLIAIRLCLKHAELPNNSSPVAAEGRAHHVAGSKPAREAKPGSPPGTNSYVWWSWPQGRSNQDAGWAAHVARARIAGGQLGRLRGTLSAPPVGGWDTPRQDWGTLVPVKPGGTDHFHTQNRWWRQGGSSHPPGHRLCAPVPIPQLLPGRGGVATAARPLGPRLPGRRGGRGLHGRRRALSVPAVLNTPERWWRWRPGASRLGSTQCGMARLCLIRRLSTWPGSARRSSTRLDSVRLGSVRLCPAGLCPARRGACATAEAGPARGRARGRSRRHQESCGGNCNPRASLAVGDGAELKGAEQELGAPGILWEKIFPHPCS